TRTVTFQANSHEVVTENAYQERSGSDRAAPRHARSADSPYAAPRPRPRPCHCKGDRTQLRRGAADRTRLAVPRAPSSHQAAVDHVRRGTFREQSQSQVLPTHAEGPEATCH